MKNVYLTIFMAIFLMTPLSGLNAQERIDSRPDQLEGQIEAEREKRKKRMEAQKRECLHVVDANIDVERSEARIMFSQALDSIDVAKEKSKIYETTYSTPEGSIGQTVISPTIAVELEVFPTAGCSYIKNMTLTVDTTHEIYIATEYQPGTCMYDMLYELENELLLQDETLASDYYRELKDMMLNDRLPNVHIYGPERELSVLEIKNLHMKAINDFIKGYLERATASILDIRKNTDLPEFYREIKAECGVP